MLKYHNVYMRTSEYRIKKEQTDAPGWNNTHETMKSLIEDYKDGLRSREFLNRSHNALSECLAFNYNADGYVYHSGWKDPKDNSGARINHGDHVVADALCWKLIVGSKRLIQVNPDTGAKDEPAVFQTGSLAWRAELDRMRRKRSDSWV
jgi:hypothetical protein